MGQTAADRQYGYRFFHPPLNITLQSQWELAVIREACHQQGTTPREIRLAWARTLSLPTEIRVNPPTSPTDSAMVKEQPKNPACSARTHRNG